MKNQLLLAVSAIAVLTVAAVAEEGSEKKKNLTCTTTVDGGQTKTICTSDDGKMKIEKNIACKTIVNGAETKTTCTPDEGHGAATWQQKDGPHVMMVPGGDGDDVDVQVFNDGKTEKRVMIVRTHGGPGSADANKDGKVSRKEFLARAEKHFAEMDKNGNGSLEGEELHPPMPPMPPLPPVPPVPPVPPAPPAQN